MSGIVSILWTVASATSTTHPKPVFNCRRCDVPRAFESSGKFRLNANGKRLDAWLVYRCRTCSANWNRPIFERRHRAGIDPAMLDALHANDPALAAEVAADRAGLSRWASRVEELEDDAPSIRRSLRAGSPADATVLDIKLRAPAPFSMRTDRLVALGLGLSRARVSSFMEQRRILGSAGSPPPRMLRDGAAFAVSLDGSPDAAALIVRAMEQSLVQD